MARREVLHLPGVEHKAPIPTAVKIGNMVYTSALIGFDTDTSKRPDSVEAEAANVFKHLRTIMEQADGCTDNIAHLDVFLSDNEYRDVVNKEWNLMFPDENDRPTRHITLKELQGGLRVQIIAVGVLS